jgi:DNA adenine methylase
MKQGFLFKDVEASVVNVASVPQRSPFRYPGGKTWFVPRFREWISSLGFKPAHLIEPFVGGGIISLTSVMEDLAEKAYMVELDHEIAAVWKTLVEGDGEWLAQRILNFSLSRETAIKELETPRATAKEVAFQTMLKNRTFHGGILAEGSGFLKNGEAGKGILSRWYPETLARRIRAINEVVHRLEFVQGDAFEVLKKFKRRKNVAFFIDPPYTAGGKRAGSRLYNHCELDHEKLFSLCEELEGPFLMTYDNADEVIALAKKHGFEYAAIPMKNTHHAKMNELIISRDLKWNDGFFA